MTPEEKRERQREAYRRWYRKNPDKVREHKAKFLAKNPTYLKEWAAANPDKTKAARRRYYAGHQAEESARGQRRYHSNPEKERGRVREYRQRKGEAAKLAEAAGHRRRQYGLTPEAFDQMLQAQDGRCAICAKCFSITKPCVDHDHDTGAVRGLLCRDCNLGLGYYERVGFSQSAQQYLDTHAPIRQTDAA